MDLYQSLVTVNPVTLIAQICNLFIQLLIVKIFFLDKIKAVLDKRRETADKQIADAEAAKSEAAAIKQTYEENMRQAKTKADDMILSAQKTAAQRSEEVEMPESTAEFAVRHGSKAVLLFLFDEVGNAFVLELREILTRKLARMEGLAGFKKALGTKKAADDVGTVRGIHAGHGNFSLMKNEGAAILPPPEVNVWIEIIAASRLSRVPLKGKIARF